MCAQESVPSELMTFNMVVSVLWAAYNSIPPLLLLHFAFAGYKGMRTNVRICGVLATLIMLGVIICVWLLLPPTFDFGKVSMAATPIQNLVMLSKRAAFMPPIHLHASSSAQAHTLLLHSHALALRLLPLQMNSTTYSPATMSPLTPLAVTFYQPRYKRANTITVTNSYIHIQ